MSTFLTSDGRRRRSPLIGLTLAFILIATSCGSTADLSTSEAAPGNETNEAAPTTTQATEHSTAPEAEPEDEVGESPPTTQGLEGLIACADNPRLSTELTGTLGATSNPDDRVMGVIYTYSQEHLDTYAGRWIDRDSGGVIVVAFTDDPEPHRTELLARGPRETDEVGVEPPPPITDASPLGERDDVVIDVVQAAHTEAELMATQMQLHNLLGPENGLIGSGINEIGNVVSVELLDPTPSDLELVWEVLARMPVCVNVFMSPAPPDGPLDIIPAPGESFELPPALGEVTWELDPAFPAPTASDTTIHVLATERGCANGRDMGDALRGPQVVETDTEVLVGFAVVINFGGATCPANPSTPVTIELDAPLGDRTLLDGADPRS